MRMVLLKRNLLDLIFDIGTHSWRTSKRLNVIRSYSAVIPVSQSQSFTGSSIHGEALFSIWQPRTIQQFNSFFSILDQKSLLDLLSDDQLSQHKVVIDLQAYQTCNSLRSHPYLQDSQCRIKT